MARFWVYIGDKIQGPVEIPALRKIPGFNLLTQVCLEGEQAWRMADEVIEIKSYFISPPRLNSFTMDAGNTAPRLDPFPKPVIKPVIEELTLPEPTSLEQFASPAVAKKAEAAATGAPAAGLRAVCEICGYKNPRDVAVCMKCGEKLKGGSAPSSMPVAGTPVAAAPMTGLPPTPVAAAPTATIPDPVATEVDTKAGTMVEISMSKLIGVIAAAGLVAGGSFFGYHAWKMKHPSSRRVTTARPASQESSEDAESAPRSSNAPTRRSGKHYDHPQVRHHAVATAAVLPGVSPSVDQAPAETEEPKEKSAPSYKVIAEATPLQKRYSSPPNSPYAQKRRADQSLWTTQEGQAIQQVQRTRIYGGQRTIERNVEILMQILRDREYNTAFESGQRLYLYNDMDWAAVQKEGPLYEVRLTFSGGKEADGSPKKPLHFAFASDLERGTVEPGGADQVRSNTLHAFFDESRIAPEDRRAIARDTEELVAAAQPEASPLAFDTVARQFAKVYSVAALSRVADAFGLTEVKKKLEHDPRLGTEGSMATPPVASAGDKKAPAATKESAPPPAVPIDFWVKAGMSVPSSASGASGSSASREAKSASAKHSLTKEVVADGIEFQMEAGNGRERTFSVRLESRASVNRIWEALTGYDRLKQFVPDMLVSEREGQDGAAAIVHITCLTRFMIFVFKMNLHLRIIEHPQQHTLEFEKIAGDYETLKGSIEVTTDPATRQSQIIFHSTVVPSSYVTNTKLEGMARRLLLTQAAAIRTKAESN